MKVTKSQLKQLIKEEYEALLEETRVPVPVPVPSPNIGRPRRPLRITQGDESGALKGLMAMGSALDEGHGGEGSMAQGQLQRIGELADMISQQFDDSTNLEEWVEAKITKSLDYLSTVMNYMRGQDDEATLRQADERAAAEILGTRMGSYRGTTLPGGEKIK